jgi:hypothetical protein
VVGAAVAVQVRTLIVHVFAPDGFGGGYQLRSDGLDALFGTLDTLRGAKKSLHGIRVNSCLHHDTSTP